MMRLRVIPWPQKIMFYSQQEQQGISRMMDWYDWPHWSEHGRPTIRLAAATQLLRSIIFQRLWDLKHKIRYGTAVGCAVCFLQVKVFRWCIWTQEHAQINVLIRS